MQRPQAHVGPCSVARALWHTSASGTHAQKRRSTAPLLGATCADKCGSLAHLKQDGQAVDDGHVQVAGVVEHDMLELDMVLDHLSPMGNALLIVMKSLAAVPHTFVMAAWRA